MNSNSKIDYSLGISAIKDISFDDYDKNFTFIVNKKKYYTSRIVADLLSPKIRQYHLFDKTFDSFYIDIPNVSLKCDFSSVISLTSFESKNLNKNEQEYFRNIFFLLGNKKEFIKLTPKYDEDVSVENVFDRINIIENYTKLRELNKKNNKCKYKCNVEEIMVGNDAIRHELDFISSHFSEIDTSKIKKLSPSIIEDIISNAKLQLKDEDSLLRFILDIYSQNHELSYLFGYVNFLNVSQKVFLKFSSIFEYDDLSPYIWNSIMERTNNLLFDTAKTSNDDKSVKQQDKEILIPYMKNKEFQGIINYLTEKTGSNIYENRTIDISSNFMRERYHPKNLLNFNFNNNNCYQAGNGDDYAWVKIDFQNNLVKITNYSIKSCNAGKDNFHLKSWVIETSEDGVNWNIIDERSNCAALNGKNLIASFKTHQDDYARYVKIRQTGEPWGGGHTWFRAIEFYGFIEHA